MKSAPSLRPVHRIAGMILLWVSLLVLLGSCGPKPEGKTIGLVQGGLPVAEIVVAENPPRMTALAVEELQTHLEKISGARLPEVHSPSGELPVQVYVGRSEHTDALGIAVDDLEDGAFRMVSGDNWLALVGKDEDYVPKGPHTFQPSTHEEHGALMLEWDRLAGGTYRNPVGGRVGRDRNRTEGWFQQDQRGSLNAVYEFLRGQGVRWYMPGELGEIIPQSDTVTFAANQDLELRPSYPVRIMAFSSFHSTPREEILWYLRLGLSHYSTLLGNLGTHGLREILGREEIQQEHPEYFALVSGRRDNQRELKSQGCLSSEGLFEETVRYARAVFDVYGEPAVSIMPPDSMRFCECELCVGKDTPDDGPEGIHSDYVWNFINRVAIELEKTHPDRKIVSCAYSTYTLPPKTIEQLSPNILVGIVHGRSPGREPQERAALRDAWKEKTSNPLMFWEHYPFTHRGTFLPVYFPKRIAKDLATLKGESAGEFIETAIAMTKDRGHGLHAPEFNHLNVYVTAGGLWDADQDFDALLDEYYELFYGPAAEEMSAFVDYSEANWQTMKGNLESIDTALELLNAAVAKAPEGTPYAERLALLDNFFNGLRAHREVVARGRVDVPQATVVIWDGERVKVDGKLDDGAWQRLPAFALSNNEDGSPAEFKTDFRLFWQGGRLGGDLYVGISCQIPEGLTPLAAGERNGDTAIFDGETVELLIETPAHSYYQIVVNPNGLQIDLDRFGGKLGYQWTAQAEVATHVENGIWIAEIRIPVAGQDVLADPFTGIAGRRPTPDLPWHINVVRSIPGASAKERKTLSWSPTKSKTVHEALKFGNVQCRK